MNWLTPKTEIVHKPVRPKRHLERSHTVPAPKSVPSLPVSVLASDFPHARRTSGPKMGARYCEIRYVVELFSKSKTTQECIPVGSVPPAC